MPVAKYSILGSGLAAQDLKELLNRSYNKTPSSYGQFIVDPSLSGRRVQVYRNAATGQVVVAHRGTEGIHDWLTDLRYGTLGAQDSARFQHSNRIQKLAEQKYGPDIITIGHSLGGVLAEANGRGEVLTLNKPAGFGSAKPNPRQVDIRSSMDPVSSLRAYDRTNKLLVVPSKTYNPITEHGVASMDALGNMLIGT